VKKIAKAAAILLSAAILFALAACGSEPAGEQEKSLYDRGLEIVSLLSDMASSREYISLLTGGEEINRILAEAAEGDFSSPKTVYKVTAGEDFFSALEGELDSLDSLPDTLRENVRTRLFTSVVTQINAMAGADTLAASSICTAGKTFVSSELTENVIYIYIYENAVPAAVSFSMGEGGAVSASGTLLLYDGFTAGSIEEVTQLLSQFGMTVEEVELR